MAIASARKMTLEEYRALPEGPPHYEFENGELIPMTSPTRKHQNILAELLGIVRPFVRENKLGEVIMEIDVYLPDGSVVIPDLVFVGSEQTRLFNPIDDKIHGSPIMMLEIISRNESRDRVEKFRIYQDNGIEWYWLADPNTLIIEEYHLTPEGYLRTASIAQGEEFRPGVFPGLVIDLAKLLNVTPEHPVEWKDDVRPEI
jgi:Uma2 family endonuclease